MSEKSVILLWVLQGLVFVWDLLTWPFYQLLYQPWKKRQNFVKIRSHEIRKTATEIVYESPEKFSDLHDQMIADHSDTMNKMWNFSVKKYNVKPLLGTREVLAHQDEVQPNGKIFKKLILGDYRWLSYDDVANTSDYIGIGLRSLGLEPKVGQIGIFADTRSEWFMMALGCFKQNFPLVTLYTNLGEEAVVHGVNQTNATVIVTSHELLPKFKTILKHTPTLKKIVYFEDPLKKTSVEGYDENVEIISFWDLVQRGKDNIDNSDYEPKPPTPSDTAIIMYTSGSTGVPKGVILSHRNLVSTMTSIVLSAPDALGKGNNTYLAYLPLAHVLELLCEFTMLVYGTKIGYSSPNTMTDKASMIKKGSKGDASLLKPTVMAAVPLILDRIYKAIVDTISKKGYVFQKVFQFCYDYRLRAIKNGESTPIMDFFIFKNMRALLGGNLKFMLCGGAPLSGETHDYMRVCLGVPMLQGYGLTETTACATVMDDMDMSTHRVGTPNQGVHLKLTNWEEGNYKVTDSPRPRGEVILGGNFVSEGYYKMPEKTSEDYYEEYGRRWFKTGDIGEIQSDGTLKIIDRKKDLVKLQFGEYVSLGKVESTLKTCSIVDNICIYGDSSKMYCVALVSPSRPHLDEIAAKHGKSELSFEELCRDKDINGAVLRELVNHGKKFKLEKFEIPGAVTLCKEMWLPDSGLVTAAFKLKRKPIQDFYQNDLDRMYGTSRGI